MADGAVEALNTADLLFPKREEPTHSWIPVSGGGVLKQGDPTQGRPGLHSEVLSQIKRQTKPTKRKE